MSTFQTNLRRMSYFAPLPPNTIKVKYSDVDPDSESGIRIQRHKTKGNAELNQQN